MSDKWCLSNFILWAGVIGFIVTFFLPQYVDREYIEMIAPLLSAASFLIVFAGILMQKDELQLQRKELNATRLVFKEQEYSMKRQRVENTIFNLNNQCVHTIDSIEVGDRKGLLSLIYIHNVCKNTKSFSYFDEYISKYVNILVSIYDVIEHSELLEEDKNKLAKTVELLITNPEKDIIKLFLLISQYKDDEKYSKLKDQFE